METHNNVTYLDHSGFLVDTPTAILIFDYYQDPADAVNRIAAENPDKLVIFLVSHHHYDHFNADIFDLLPDREKTYVLSTDIKTSAPTGLDVRYVKNGDVLNSLPGGITVTAYGSTDIGVSYYVELPDKTTIYHAGDFNYWHWQDENSVAQVKRAFNKFVKIMTSLMAHISHIDIAFFPVDPRLGNDYAAGARLFMENIDVKYFFPMHFWGDYKEACDFPSYTPDNTDSFCLYLPGETVELTASKARFMQLA